MSEITLGIIGGGQLQIPLVEEAKKLGYSTIVTDVNPNCVCSDIADNSKQNTKAMRNRYTIQK